MKSCHKNPSVQRNFLVGAYFPDVKGRMVLKEMPVECPCCEAGVECLMSVHHYRLRKTGPKHPLAVFGCKRHKKFFTAYPPGYAPYKRAMLAPEAKVKSTSEDLTPWLDTVFGAAVAAGAFDDVWSCSMVCTGERSWWTQRRQIRQAAQWLGIDLSGLKQQRMAQRLRVAVVVHTQACRIYQQASTIKQFASAVVMVLAALQPGSPCLWSILRAGKSTGLCGQAWRVMRSGKLAPFR